MLPRKNPPYTATLVPGLILWFRQHDAMTYAEVRAHLGSCRQDVRPVRKMGLTFWHVRNATAEVAEPCS